MRSDCQLDRRSWIGFNWVLQPRLTSLSAAFSKILGCCACLHKLLALPCQGQFSSCFQSVISSSLTSEYFKEFSVHAILYLRTWVYYFCGLRTPFLEFAFRAAFRNLGVWNHLAPAFLSPMDGLCSTIFVLFMFWLCDQQWWEGAAWLCNILCMQSKVTEPEGA